MIIETTKLQYLINKYLDEFICFYYSDTVIEGKKYKAGTQVLFLHTNQLLKNGISEIEIQYDVTLYEYLSREFPVEFRRPVQWVDSRTLELTLAGLEKVNTRSKRKRFLYVVGDVYRHHISTKPAQLESVFKHNDRLDLQKWRTHKGYIDSSKNFFFRNSENGIIVFGGAPSEDYFDENDLYRKKLDFAGSMVSHKFDKKTEISPDFIPNRDVYIVDNPGMLAEEYINTNARIIIFNENLTAVQKEALLQVKQYDPFVRMMVIPPISPENINDILLQLKMVYNTDYWNK